MKSKSEIFGIYIISLEHERSQANTLEKKIINLGYEGEIHHINAVDGRALSSKDYFNHIKYSFDTRRELLTPGEVGASLSHMQTLELIVSSKKPGLILEYDAILFDDFFRLMNLLKSISNPSIIQMCSSPRYIDVYNKAEILEHNKVLGLNKLKPSYGMWCTAAYAVNPEAAQYILNKQIHGLSKSDDWRKMIDPTVCDFYFKKCFDHVDEPNPKMEAERSSVPGDAVDFALKFFEADVIKKISAKKVFMNRIFGKIK